MLAHSSCPSAFSHNYESHIHHLLEVSLGLPSLPLQEALLPLLNMGNVLFVSFFGIYYSLLCVTFCTCLTYPVPADRLPVCLSSWTQTKAFLHTKGAQLKVGFNAIHNRGIQYVFLVT